METSFIIAAITYGVITVLVFAATLGAYASLKSRQNSHDPRVVAPQQSEVREAAQDMFLAPLWPVVLFAMLYRAIGQAVADARPEKKEPKP